MTKRPLTVLLAAALAAASAFVARPARAGSPLVVLEGQFQPVADHFNAAVGKQRVMAILSPTGSHCRYGARVIQAEILNRYDNDDIDVVIVWSPMLEGDDEDSARAAAAAFDDPRVTQFYDPERFIGYLYRFDVFPDAAAQMAASMPPSHPFHDAIVGRAEADRERPEWDIVMWFGRDQKWVKDAPPPSRFIRQFAHWQEGLTTQSLMWIDDMKKAPVTGDLNDYVGSVMRDLIPPEPDPR